MKLKSLLLSLAVAGTLSASAANWEVKSVSPDPKYTVEWVEDLEMMTVSFGADWNFTCASDACATLTNKETGAETKSSTFERWDMSDMAGEDILKITFPALTENGTYEFKIAAGMMTHDSSSNPVITYTYTVNARNIGGGNVDIPECELLYADPAAGTAMATPGLEAGREYTYSTNINEYVGYAEAYWHDVTGDPEEPEYLTQTYTDHEVGDSSPLIFTSYDAYSPMYTGHDYRVTVYLYDQYAYPRNEIGSFTVMYKGSAAGYEYSNIKATSVSPDPETYLIEDESEGHFTVSFSGAVEIDEAASNISHGPLGVEPYASITPNDDKTEWTFVIPTKELEERSIACFILAKDSEGRTVLGNEDMEQYQSGEGEGAGFMFTYTSQIAGAALVVTPAAGKVEELKSFTVTSADGFAIMDPSWNAYPQLMKDKELVYKFNLESDVERIDGDESSMVLVIPDDKVPTVNGRYELVFPFNSFMFMRSVNDQGGTASKYLVVSYILGEEPQGDAILDLMPESITPAAGNVDEIKTVDIHYAQDVNLLLFDAYILNDKGEQIAKADIQFDDDWDNLVDYHITFDPAITAPGVYTLFIPQETFGDQAYTDTGKGHANADIRVEYTVGDVSVETLVAEGFVGNVYSVTGMCVLRNAKAEDLKTLEKGIYVVNGKKAVIF